MKRGSRVLGIVETSPVLGRSLLCGAITTRFLLEDVGIEFITIGGMDGTDGALRLIRRLYRKDLKLVLFSGRIVAGYNLIDVVRIHEEIGLPVVVVPYGRPKKRISEIIRKIFDDYEERLRIYRRVKSYSVPLSIGGRERIGIVIGIDPKEAEAFLNSILIGKTPYPIYVADRIARGLRNSFASLRL